MALTVGALNPRNTTEGDALLSERLRLIRRGLTVDPPWLGFTAMNPAGLIGELATNIIAAFFDLCAKSLKQRTRLVGNTASQGRAPSARDARFDPRTPDIRPVHGQPACRTRHCP